MRYRMAMEDKVSPDTDPVIHEGGPWGGYDGYFIEIGKQQILVAGRDF